LSFKSGFVILIGRPNVGKSTLANQLVGQKLAIVSNKPQTTRNKIRLILNRPDAQIIFLDTPGIHKPKHKLGEHLVELAIRTLKEADVICFLVEVLEMPGKGDEYILKQIQNKNIKTPVFLVVNKIDMISKNKLIEAMENYSKLYNFDEIIPVSALTGENIGKLVKLIIDYLPEGHKYYPEDQVTDLPESFIIADLIREKVLYLTKDEVPHSVFVTVDEIKKKPNNLIIVMATIYVERDSQKAILIGKNGSMLKKIGQLARKEIEVLFGTRMYLDLWVKVKKDWRNREEYFKKADF